MWTLNVDVVRRDVDWVDSRSGPKSFVYHARVRNIFEKVYAKCMPQTQQSIVRTICEEILRRTVSAANPYGLSPLHWAAQKNFTDLTELVTSMKHTAMPAMPVVEAARPAFSYMKGKPAIMARTTWHRSWVASVVDPVTFNGLETTPLMKAAVSGHTKVVDVLVRQRACLDAQDVDGRTPLIMAASGGRTECVRLLIELHARTDPLTLRGQNALHEAALYGHFETVKALLELGADPSVVATDRTDWRRCDVTAAGMARRSGHFAVASLLEAAESCL